MTADLGTDGPGFAVRTDCLTKRFGPVTAVSDLTLSVRTGARLGLLGPNGSGKSTLVRMLLGLVYPTSGTIELLGEPMPRSSRLVLPRVGALVEGPAAYRNLSGRRNLLLLDAAGPGGSRHDRGARVDATLTTVGLANVSRRRVRGYSLGMRQRLGLASALLRSPQLLLLDEPTNGLDPHGIHELHELLLKINARGTTVVLSSHLLTEVETLCSDVAVLDRGRLVVHCPIAELRQPTGHVVVHTDAVALARTLLGERVVESTGSWLRVASEDPAALNATLVAAGVPVREIAPQRRSLEETVLALTEPSEGEGPR